MRSTDEQGLTPVMAAAYTGRSVEVLRALIHAGADLTTLEAAGVGILEVAMMERHFDVVEVLLDTLGGPQYPKNSVALQIAMAHSHIMVVGLMTSISLMYDFVDSASLGQERPHWAKWVLDLGGELVRPKALSNMLNAALHDEKLDLVEELLGLGGDPNTQLPSGHTSLSHAVRRKNLKLLEVLLNAGADPTKTSPGPASTNLDPLHQAVLAIEDDLEKDTSLIDLLLASGRCKLLVGDRPESTVFSCLLSRCGEWNHGVAEIIIFRMLESVQDVNQDRCDNESTLLHVAAKHGREDLMEILLQRGAKINATEDLGFTPFLVECHNSIAVLPFLLKHGADSFAKDDFGQTGMHMAAMNGKTDIMAYLLTLGLDINATDEIGYTPLITALDSPQEGAATWLLDHGADSTIITSKDQRSTLHYATQHRLDAMASRLLATNTLDINARDKLGSTPLALAALHNSPSTITLLLTHGADPEIPEHDLNRPLHIALTMGNDTVAELLITHGVDVKATGHHGSTPLHLAVQFRNYASVQALLEAGVDVNAIDDSGRTPLCVCTCSLIAGRLVEFDADVEIRDKRGWTAAHYAVNKGANGVLDVLIRAGADLGVKAGDDGWSVVERVGRMRVGEGQGRVMSQMRMMVERWERRQKEMVKGEDGRKEMVEIVVV